MAGDRGVAGGPGEDAPRTQARPRASDARNLLASRGSMALRWCDAVLAASRIANSGGRRGSADLRGRRPSRR